MRQASHVFEEVGDANLVLFFGQALLHFAVRVVDDSQEHVDENEEDEEDVHEEIDRTKYAVSRLHVMKVEVAKDDAEQSEAGRRD